MNGQAHYRGVAKQQLCGPNCQPLTVLGTARNSHFITEWEILQTEHVYSRGPQKQPFRIICN